MENNSQCIVSLKAKTKVYHKPGCHHVKNMKDKNKMTMTLQKAERKGYRICRCCNCMAHHKRVEQKTITNYENNKGMEFNFVKGALYVKTEIGCWKMVYTRGDQRMVLYHRNATNKELDFKKPQYEKYHRQGDVPYSDSIAHYLNYIYEHDRFKQAERNGQMLTSYSSKKNKRLAEKSRRKSSHKRVDYLFRMLESQNAGYRQLSFC